MLLLKRRREVFATCLTPSLCLFNIALTSEYCYCAVIEHISSKDIQLISIFYICFNIHIITFFYIYFIFILANYCVTHSRLLSETQTETLTLTQTLTQTLTPL